MDGSTTRWLDVAKKQERLVVNRQFELKYGASPKKERKALRAYDKRIMNAIKKHKNGTFTLTQYWNKIIELKLDYGYNQFT